MIAVRVARPDEYARVGELTVAAYRGLPVDHLWGGYEHEIMDTATRATDSDILVGDVVYEVLYNVPGWPRAIRSRADLMVGFRGYVENIALQSADKLIVHRTDGDHVVVIEYEVHGVILATGVQYDNRFCSIITIENRKIAHWRDYMDSLAAWNALTAK